VLIKRSEREARHGKRAAALPAQSSGGLDAAASCAAPA